MLRDRSAPSCSWNRNFASPLRWPIDVVEHGRVIDMIPDAALEANREQLKTSLGV